MAYDSEGNRTLLWICASLLLVFFIGSIWYWFYLQYHQKEDLRSSVRGQPGDRNQQAHSGPAQQQDFLGPQVGSGNGNYELETLHGNTQRKTGGDISAAETITVPPPSAARNDLGECYANQAPTNIVSPLNKAALAQPRQNTADQRAIELSMDGRRHYSVTSSDSSGTPQMTPETGSSAAQTPDGPRTPLPRYTLEPCGADPPVYAESEPSAHAAHTDRDRGTLRRPTY